MIRFRVQISNLNEKKIKQIHSKIILIESNVHFIEYLFYLLESKPPSMRLSHENKMKNWPVPCHDCDNSFEMLIYLSPIEFIEFNEQIQTNIGN